MKRIRWQRTLEGTHTVAYMRLVELVALLKEGRGLLVATQFSSLLNTSMRTLQHFLWQGRPLYSIDLCAGNFLPCQSFSASNLKIFHSFLSLIVCFSQDAFQEFFCPYLLAKLFYTVINRALFLGSLQSVFMKLLTFAEPFL